MPHNIDITGIFWILKIEKCNHIAESMNLNNFIIINYSLIYTLDTVSSFDKLINFNMKLFFWMTVYLFLFLFSLSLVGFITDFYQGYNTHILV